MINFFTKIRITMKSLKYIFAAAALSCLGTACNESNWLEETPYDFYTPGNSYTTTAQFQQALNYLYDQVRGMRWKLGDQHMALICSDLASGGTDTNPVAKFNDYKTFITPYTYVSSSFWDISYAAIANANTIISRIDMENEVGEADKKVFKGQALFFRDYFYNFLANLYGGVPLILEEASEPRQDYVRASREETYDRARQDLEDAVLMLNDITAAKDGEVNIQAAKHLLTEVYISLGDYQKAIDAATDVIDDPNMELMDTRFGSRQGETANGESPYWDLFQLNNQNRSSGNKETIWALQYEYKNSGSPYSNELPRWLLPYYEGLNVPGKSGNDVKAFTLNTMEKGGRGIGTIRPTDHFLYEIWDAGDDRNSELLIKRDYQIDNPDAVDFGKWIMADHIYETLNTEQQTRQFYPFVLKFSQVGTLEEDNYAKNSDGSYQMTALGEHGVVYAWGSLSANTSMRDEYMYRLAGTYLLRAEAYYWNNEPGKAKEDLNKVRQRANAPAISESDVSLDFILDEQLRELYFEDFRVPTLCRLGKMVERSRKYNPFGMNVGDQQNLFPIPYSEIEKNIFGTMEQNPGYEGF